MRNNRIIPIIKTTVPTVSDDTDLGYVVGSEWIDTVTGRIYKCLDNAVGAANWQEVVLGYSEKFTQAGVTSSLTWVTIPVPTAFLDSVLTIVIYNGSNSSKSVGVREVGSILDRRLDVPKEVTVTYTVKTDSSGNFEIHSDGDTSVLFYIIS